MKIVYDANLRSVHIQIGDESDTPWLVDATLDDGSMTYFCDDDRLTSVMLFNVTEVPVLEVIEKKVDPYATPVRLAVVADNYGLSRGWEQDAADIVQHFEAERFNVTVVGKSQSIVAVADRDCDVLVVDYGGADVGTNGGSGLAIDTARRAYEWAREHPGRLLVLYTGFTARTYREVTEEIQAEDLGNVVMMSNYDDNTEQWQKIKRWCGGS